MLWGVSKDLGASGLCEANLPLVRTFHCDSFPSSATELIVSQMLEDKAWTEWYMARNCERLGEAYAFMAAFLEEHDVPYYKSANARFSCCVI